MWLGKGSVIPVFENLPAPYKEWKGSIRPRVKVPRLGLCGIGVY